MPSQIIFPIKMSFNTELHKNYKIFVSEIIKFCCTKFDFPEDWDLNDRGGRGEMTT